MIDSEGNHAEKPDHAGPREPRPCVVFHAGSLGDSVMIWPLLRVLLRRGGDVTLVSSKSKAALAQSALNPQLALGPEIAHNARGRLSAQDIEQPRFNALWSRGAIAAEARDDSVARVISFLVEPGSEVGRAWAARAAELFPRAEITLAGAPGSRSRNQLWACLDVHTTGQATVAITPPDAPIVLHVGAGGRDKRWPLERFITLRDLLAARHKPSVRLIAGEVEQEHFTIAERAAFDRAGGQIIIELEELARALGAARLVIASDTGPGHLAAQLGVPTLSLFGPTDASVWSPTGPRVRVLKPAKPSPMEWLSVDEVARAGGAMLSERPSGPLGPSAAQ